MKTVVVLNRVLMGLLLATLLVYWRLFWLLFSAPSSEVTVLTLAYLVLLVVALVGLWLQRPWGYYTIYLLVPVSTFALAISFVPFLVEALPAMLRPAALPIVNASVLMLAAVAHSAYRRTHAPAAA